MAVDPASIKCYQCATWAEGLTHGGAISATEITSGVDQNVFDDVTNAERVAGDTEYRKIYIKNENADTWEGVKLWISTQTPATNSIVSIVAGIGADTQADADDYVYVSPDSKVHADVITVGNLVQNASASVWIKRVISAAGSGYTDDTFTLAWESS